MCRRAVSEFAVLLWLPELVVSAPLEWGYVKGSFLTVVGSSHITLPLPADMNVQVCKRAGRWTQRPLRVVRAASGVSGDVTARGDCVGGGIVVVVSCLVSFSMNGGLILCADIVIVLPRTEICGDGCLARWVQRRKTCRVFQGLVLRKEPESHDSMPGLD